MQKNIYSSLLIAALALAPFSTTVMATETVTVMDEVVVTAARTSQELQRTPASVTVIDQDVIVLSNAQTVVDLLRQTEGVFVRDQLGTGRQAVVDLRGFGETGVYNTLVLVDGRRVNDIDLSGVDWTQIPLSEIERVEVVRGSGTVLYGDNASGGVINIITRTPSTETSVSAKAEAGSYGYANGSFSMSGGSERFGTSIGVRFRGLDGYRQNNELASRDLVGKIRFSPSQNLALELSGSHHVDEYGMPGHIPEAQLAVDRTAAGTPYAEAGTEDHYLNLRAVWDHAGPGSLEADLSFRKKALQAEWPDPAFPWGTDSETETLALTPRYVWTGPLAGLDNTLIVGVDLYQTSQDGHSFQGFYSPATLAGTSTVDKDTLAVYLQDTLAVTDKLSLTAGGRHERADYSLKVNDLTGFLAPLNTTFDADEFAFIIGSSYLLGDRSSVFARVNTSLRFPLTDELVVNDYVNYRITANESLKPQKGLHYEVGVRHQLLASVSSALTLYRTEMEDEIFLNRFPSFSNENHPETLHQGVEISLQADVTEFLVLTGGYTYTKATFEAEPFKGNDIPAVPAHKVNAGIRLVDLVPGLLCSADLSYLGDSYMISDQANAFDKLKGYYTVDLGVNYTWNQIKAFVSLKNATDQDYSEYGVLSGVGAPSGRAFYPSAGRTWVAGVAIPF